MFALSLYCVVDFFVYNILKEDKLKRGLRLKGGILNIEGKPKAYIKSVDLKPTL